LHTTTKQRMARSKGEEEKDSTKIKLPEYVEDQTLPIPKDLVKFAQNLVFVHLDSKTRPEAWHAVFQLILYASNQGETLCHETKQNIQRFGDTIQEELSKFKKSDENTRKIAEYLWATNFASPNDTYVLGVQEFIELWLLAEDVWVAFGPTQNLSVRKRRKPSRFAIEKEEESLSNNNMWLPLGFLFGRVNPNFPLDQYEILLWCTKSLDLDKFQTVGERNANMGRLLLEFARRYIRQPWLYAKAVLAAERYYTQALKFAYYPSTLEAARNYKSDERKLIADTALTPAEYQALKNVTTDKEWITHKIPEDFASFVKVPSKKRPPINWRETLFLVPIYRSSALPFFDLVVSAPVRRKRKSTNYYRSVVL